MALNLFCLQCGTWVLSFCCVEQLFYPQHQVRPCAPVERGHTQDLDRRADITSYLRIPGVPAGAYLPWAEHTMVLRHPPPGGLSAHTCSRLPFRSAVEEGKGIFYNIKNFVRFQLST